MIQLAIAQFKMYAGFTRAPACARAASRGFAWPRTRNFARFARLRAPRAGFARARSASRGLLRLASRVLRIARLRLVPASRTHLHARLRTASRGFVCFARLVGGFARAASRGLQPWRVLSVYITGRVSRGFPRFAWFRASRGLRARASRGFTRLAPASCRTCARAASRGFARFAWLRAGFARALRARGFARLRALRAGSVRAPAHARLRAASRAASRGFARFARAGRVPGSFCFNLSHPQQTHLHQILDI